MKTLATLRGSPWWVLVFFIVGVFATAAVVFGLFFSLGRRLRMTASVLPPVDSAEFLTASAGLSTHRCTPAARSSFREAATFFPASSTRCTRPSGVSCSSPTSGNLDAPVRNSCKR
jgi:hypothetical protein